MKFNFFQTISFLLAVLFLSIFTLSYTFADNIIDNKYPSNIVHLFDFFDTSEAQSGTAFYSLASTTIPTISSTTNYQNSQDFSNQSINNHLNFNGYEYGIRTKVTCVNGSCSMKRQPINADQARDMHIQIRKNNQEMDAILKARFEAHSNYLNSMFFDK